MFLTWADHVQACAADFILSLGDVRGLLAGSVVALGGAAASIATHSTTATVAPRVVRRLCHRVRDGLNLM